MKNKKIKHSYICHEPSSYAPGTVSFKIKTDEGVKGTMGVYDTYGSDSSNHITKFKALRYLVSRKHEVMNSK